MKTGGGSSGNTGPIFFDDIYVEQTAALNLRLPMVHTPDFDHDGDVDLVDADTFIACLG